MENKNLWNFDRRTEAFENYANGISKILGENAENLKDFLAFQGKFYKIPTADVIGLYGQSEKCEMLTGLEAWRNFDRSVKEMEKSRVTIGANGELSHFFDISQTDGEPVPERWALNQGLARELRQNLNQKNGTEYANFRELIEKNSYKKLIPNMAEYCKILNVPAEHRKEFANSVFSLTCHIIAERCCLDSNFKFELELNKNALKFIKNIDDVKEVLTFAGYTAKSVLLDIEREIRNIKNLERFKENGNLHNNSRERSDNNSNEQRNGGVPLQEVGQMVSAETNRERGLDGNNKTSRNVLPIGSGVDERPSRAETFGRTSGNVRGTLAEVDGGKLPEQGDNPPNELPIPDIGTDNRPRSGGDGGDFERRIREDDSSARERIYGESGVQKDESVGSPEPSNEGIRSSTPNELTPEKPDNYGENQGIYNHTKEKVVINDKSEEVKTADKPKEVTVGDEITINGETVTIKGLQSFDMMYGDIIVEKRLGNIVNQEAVTFDTLRENGYSFVSPPVDEKAQSEKVVINDKSPKTPPKKGGVSRSKPKNDYSQLMLLGFDEPEPPPPPIFEVSIDKTPIEDNQEKVVINDKSPSENFKITDENLGTGGTRDKIESNILAISTVKTLELENRNATKEEQEILSKYVGWGGLSDVFDERKSNFAAEREQLKNTLTTEEFESARGSTLNAHYTSPTVISAMYSALESFGVPKNAKILEPSCGVGNFFGCSPDDTNYKFSGVELDKITASIAKHLYPNSKIQNVGFENTAFKDNSFDVAIGNIPFGNYHVNDKDYNKQNFFIHDYFFAKSIDKVASGGIVAFITSKGTLDKIDPKAREILAEKTEFIGAIRLPNNAFKANAGTEVTSDIIFLKKRDFSIEIGQNQPSFCVLGKTDDGVPVNQYFAENPKMILGKMTEVSGRYGVETACLPIPNADLKEQLSVAVKELKSEFSAYLRQKSSVQKETKTLEAPLEQRNWTFVKIDDSIYFKENDELIKQNLNSQDFSRLSGILEVRNAVRNIIDEQVRGCTDEELSILQDKLNAVYENFTSKFGFLTDKKNTQIFKNDDDCHLIASLEDVKIIDDERKITKAEIFSKRTIRPEVVVEKTETPEEAMFVSLDQYGIVDLDFIANLCEKTKDECIENLVGNNHIFFDPSKDKYVETSEYLSGNVREKLRLAELSAKENPDLERNVKSLKEVVPKNIPATDISVRLGSAWIKTDDYRKFLSERLGGLSHSNEVKRGIDGEYKIKNKSWDRSVKSTSAHGTKRMNMYEILENSLNQRDIIVRDKVTLPDGKETYQINGKETQLAQEKARQMGENFVKWLWENPQRREFYVREYNEKYNSIVGRKYDGSRQTFPSMNPNIHLREHQKNAIARAKYGGNSLFAHVVGAGKSFELIASTMEKKRIGLINKAAVVVPKALTSQTALEWQRLYPNAKLLVATEKDFTKENRNRFVARLTTGNYDAVIMSYEQFEKMPMSAEHKEKFMRDEIAKVTMVMAESDGYSVKDLERKRKALKTRLDKFLTAKKRDTAIEFEQTGIDFLVVDESHNYKNGLVISKMRNISGIGSTPAQKCEDMLMKCNYLNEKYDYSRIIFASGTPVSNSLSELYTTSMYLRPDLMRSTGVAHFDDWAATFAKVNTTMEMSAGGGYKPKKRLNEFVNLPELMKIYHEFADVKNAEDLNLPVPELENGKNTTVVAKPSDFQLQYIRSLADRSKAISSGTVDPRRDNMLKITHEARLLGLDERCIDISKTPIPNSKINICLENLMKIYEETNEQKGVQAIFCDIAVNSGKSADGKDKFSVYDNIKEELIKRGVPENEIAFASDADTPAKKTELIANLNNGTKRFIIASTSKFGTGANFQKRLSALHHLDIPWKPSDLTQREGRILRQGNTNEKVKIFNYVTEGTFDAYLMGIIVNKQKFISQLMSGKTSGRTCGDVSETVLNYAEIQALASGDPRVKEKIDLDVDVLRLKMLKNSFTEEKFRLQDVISANTIAIKSFEQKLELAKMDSEIVNYNTNPQIMLNNNLFSERKEAGETLEILLARAKSTKKLEEIGKIGDFTLKVEYIPPDFLTQEPCFRALLSGKLEHSVDLLENNPVGNISRILNCYANIPLKTNDIESKISRLQSDISSANMQLSEKFSHEDELSTKQARLDELNKEFMVADDVIADTDEDFKSAEASENVDVDQTKKVTEVLGK